MAQAGLPDGPWWLASYWRSLPNRPAGSGRSRPDTHYCAKCRSLVVTTIIRGYNGAKDHHRCETCGRTWPR